MVTVNPATNRRLSVPAGMARPEVLGLAASRPASAQRLNAMAADRAVTMQTTIQNTLGHAGHPEAASIAPDSAKGRAKMECSHLIISRVIPTLRSKAMDPVYRDRWPRCRLERTQVDFSRACRLFSPRRLEVTWAF